MLDMSQNAIVMVIAHRLKTIENAIGIMDFSLLAESKKLEFLPKEILLSSSNYYKGLMEGKIALQ
jgi:ABC-type multidrug transport system fused ATPase/permease subunit